MAFDFTSLNPAVGSLYKPRLGRATTLDSSTELGHATWKEEELLNQSPQYLQALAQQDVAYAKLKEQQMIQDKMEAAKRAKEKEDYEKWEREQLLNSVADSKYLDKVMSGEMGSSQLLAEQAKKAAAEAMRRGQGKYAKDFLDVASKYDQEAKKYEATQIQVQDAKLEQAREILGTVNDPVSWAYAKPKLAEAGVNIPQEFQSWGPETAKWVDAESRKAKAVQSAERLDLLEKNAAYKKERDAAKDEEKAAKDKAKQRDEALKRELQGAGKPPTKEQTGILIGSFKGNEDFESLETEDQLKAASEFEPVTRYFLTTEQAKTRVEAEKMAKEDILARSKGGKFTPFVSGIPQATKTGGVASPTSKADFDALPSGTKYINPADGKTYIKK